MRTKPIVNNGLNLEKEKAAQDGTERVFGALSPASLVSIPQNQRKEYLPLGETQFDGFGDFQDCASRSPVNHCEAFLTYHYQHDMLPENKLWLEQNGYVDTTIPLAQRRVTFSDRFIAKLSGTTHTGNSLKAPLDAIRNKGLIPKSRLPKTDSMTWDEYYADIPQELIDLGQEFARRFTIVYEQVQRIHIPEVLKDDMVGVAGYAWPDPDANDVYHSNKTEFNHAFLIYNLPAFQIFDNYTENNDPNDFTKNLAPDYTLYDYGYRVILAAEKKTLDDAATFSLLQTLSDILKSLSDYLFKQEATIPPVPPTIPPKPLPIDIWARAIQAEESSKPPRPTDVNIRLKNPGNLKFTAYTKSLGGFKSTVPGLDGGTFCEFKTANDGFAALKQFLRDACHDQLKAYKGTMTLRAFTKVYALPRDDGYALNVAKKLAISVDTPIRDIIS